MPIQIESRACNLITPVKEEVLNIVDAKKHINLEVDFTDDDGYIGDLITTAREYCEDYTHRAIGTQTFELILDCFPQEKDYIELPWSPLQKINSFVFKNSEGIVETVDSEIYFVDTDFKPGKICLNYNRYWPMYIPLPYASVKINFDAGHTTNDVPKRIIQAMKLLIGHWYEHREQVSTARKIENIPFGVDNLLWPLKVW